METYLKSLVALRKVLISGGKGYSRVTTQTQFWKSQFSPGYFPVLITIQFSKIVIKNTKAYIITTISVIHYIKLGRPTLPPVAITVKVISALFIKE